MGMVTKAYLSVQNKINSLLKNEDGAQVVEYVIIILVAAILVGVLLTVLTGSSDGSGEDGLIGSIVTKIKETLGIN